MIVEILGQVNFLFLDRPDETLGVAVLPGLAHTGHADLDISILEHLGIGSGSILYSLVGVMNSWAYTSRAQLLILVVHLVFRPTIL
jgi:hypothetical protein